MKIFLGILFLIISTYVGYRASLKYTLRKKYYKDFFQFNSSLKNNVRFTLDSINKTIESFLNKGDFIRLFLLIINDKKQVGYVIKYLNNDENEFMYNYVNSIGKTDRESQLNYLIYVEGEISQKLKNSEEDEKKYKQLYVKLGFLFGLVVLVLLL